MTKIGIILHTLLLLRTLSIAHPKPYIRYIVIRLSDIMYMSSFGIKISCEDNFPICDLPIVYELFDRVKIIVPAISCTGWWDVDGTQHYAFPPSQYFTVDFY